MRSTVIYNLTSSLDRHKFINEIKTFLIPNSGRSFRQFLVRGETDFNLIFCSVLTNLDLTVHNIGRPRKTCSVFKFT